MNLLLTGGTRGLGLEILRKQLSLGDSVVVVGRRESPNMTDLAQQYPGKLRFIALDLNDLSEIKDDLFRSFIGPDWPIHGLVNNAAIAYDDLATNLDMVQLDSMFRINVFATMILTKCVIRNMLLHKIAGSIVHISSIAASRGYKGLAMYGSTKGAVESFSRGVASEWGSMGIRSNCIAPGFMETDMSAKLTSEQKDKVYRRTALGIATSFEAVTGLVQYLLGEASRSVTGQTFTVDAGAV
jgi:3-oxoacyl-[acyl-carrier protein] reductase